MSYSSPTLRLLWVLFAVSILISGCSKKNEVSDDDPARLQAANYLLKQAPETYDVPVGLIIEDKVRVLGMDYSPKPIERGKPFSVIFYFEALEDNPGDYKFYGHLEPSNEKPYRVKLDHAILNGVLPMPKWRKGDIIKDVFSTEMPQEFPDASGTLWAGFYKGEYRLQIRGKDKSMVDKGGRIRFGSFKITELAGDIGEAVCFKVATPPVIDGQLAEDVWKSAPALSDFVIASGMHRASPITRLKVLWDPQHLYLGFECSDTDIVSTAINPDTDMPRDDQVGVIIDANSNQATYNVIWVNARGLVADSYFPSRMTDEDTSWASEMEVGIKIRGSLNVASESDVSWTVEMAIPISRLSDVVLEKMNDGNIWDINFYRRDVNSQGESSLSMWSPTLMDDPHRLERLGKLVFSDKIITDLRKGEIDTIQPNRPVAKPDSKPDEPAPGGVITQPPPISQ
jgi:hypothetical protein